MVEEIEKIYIIPLKKIGFISSKAAPTAIKRVKKYLTRHMKVEEEKIWIDDSLNNSLWVHGKYNMPTRVRVKAVKFEDGVVEAYLPELEFKKSRRELLREEREKKEPILRKEETREGEEETGDTKDYDITPSADGEVKIKKKKSIKEKEETTEEELEKKVVKDKIDEKQGIVKEELKKETIKKTEGISSKKSSLKTNAKKKTARKKE